MTIALVLLALAIGYIAGISHGFVFGLGFMEDQS